MATTITELDGSEGWSAEVVATGVDFTLQCQGPGRLLVQGAASAPGATAGGLRLEDGWAVNRNDIPSGGIYYRPVNGQKVTVVLVT